MGNSGLQGVSEVALQGDSGVGHSRETLDRSLWVGHSMESLGWALQGDSGVGHSRESLGVDRARRRVPGEEKSSGRGEELSLKSNNPTPKVGEKP